MGNLHRCTRHGGGGGNCPINFDRNERFRPISTEAFGQFVWQGEIFVLLGYIFSKCVTQNAGNGILGVKISKFSRAPMPQTTLQIKNIFLAKINLRPPKSVFACTPTAICIMD